MTRNPVNYRKGITVGLFVSLLLHLSGVAWLGISDQRPAPVVVDALLVGFTPSALAKPVPEPEKNQSPPRPLPMKAERPMPRQRVIKESLMSAKEPDPVSESVAAVMAESAESAARPSRPMTLTTEHPMVCPEQPAPAYPSISRRLGEEGVVMLKVELDDSGWVSSAQVAISSGYLRLDEAARITVSTWRCSSSLRNGQAVRSTALQAFKFTLQEN